MSIDYIRGGSSNAILAERKTSKLIELLEEQRRDNPLIHDRHDPEAFALAAAADPRKILAAIKEAHEDSGEKG